MPTTPQIAENHQKEANGVPWTQLIAEKIIKNIILYKRGKSNKTHYLMEQRTKM